MASEGPLVWIVAGEESGDQLGAKLMRALKADGRSFRFGGVGGHAMGREGLESLFPLEDIAVMGFSAVINRLPTRPASQAASLPPEVSCSLDRPVAPSTTQATGPRRPIPSSLTREPGRDSRSRDRKRRMEPVAFTV